MRLIHLGVFSIPISCFLLPLCNWDDNYTQKLYFYVEQIIKGNAMNLNKQIGFINSAEAGDFFRMDRRTKINNHKERIA